MLPTLQIDGALATIRLNRPESANRLSVEDLECLLDLIQQVNSSASTLVLKLIADGRHFCAGFDISSLDQGAQDKSLLFEVAVNAIEDCRPITIARIQGGVYGGATDLALACDFRIGSQEARMFMPAAKLGIHFYERGLQRYVSRLGLDHAKRLLLTAEELSAAQMREIGFLTDLVDEHELESTVNNLSEHLCQLAPLSLLGMKKHLNAIARNELNREELARDIAISQNSDDLQEGRQAWLEKRPPKFKGL